MTSSPKEKIFQVIDNAEVFEPEQKPRHPLDNVLALDFKPKPPQWLLDGIVQVGVVTLAGMRGVGKTTSLLPLAAAVAHLCPNSYSLRPRLRRHVIWVTEDVGQAERVLSALISHAGWSSPDEVRQWFHVVPAVRLDPDVIAEAAPIFGGRYTVQHEGRNGPISVKPLVVFDTANACLELENESDNSQVGKAMAAIKTAFSGFPVIIITHLSKSLNQTEDVRELSSRGAGAWEGDAHQCLFLVESKTAGLPSERQLLFGKKRFEADVEALKFESHVCEEVVDTDVGKETIRLRYSLAEPLAHGERAKEKQERQEEANSSRNKEMRSQALDLAEKHRREGNPVSASSLRALMSGNNTACGTVIEQLKQERWLVDVLIPTKLRRNPAKSSFLIALTDEERREYMRSSALPKAKAEIPRSWLKEDAPQT